MSLVFSLQQMPSASNTRVCVCVCVYKSLNYRNVKTTFFSIVDTYLRDNDVIENWLPVIK